MDKRAWQAEQEARDALMDKEREKHRKARERSARNAQRKLERLRRTLGESGDLSDWEDEFSESVTERLDKYGSAFADLQKGRPGDALSFSQKRIVAALNKKAKDKRKAARAQNMGADEGEGDKPKWDKPKKRSSFKSKGKKNYTPRVRQLDEDFDVEVEPKRSKAAPFIPAYAERRDEEPKKQAVVSKSSRSSDNNVSDQPAHTAPKRPFLRLVTSEPKVGGTAHLERESAKDIAS